MHTTPRRDDTRRDASTSRRARCARLRRRRSRASGTCACRRSATCSPATSPPRAQRESRAGSPRFTHGMARHAPSLPRAAARISPRSSASSSVDDDAVAGRSRHSAVDATVGESVSMLARAKAVAHERLRRSASAARTAVLVLRRPSARAEGAAHSGCVPIMPARLSPASGSIRRTRRASTASSGSGSRARRRSRRARHLVAQLRHISLGVAFETTEMMPSPPSAITGSVSSSSPDSTANSGGRPRMMSAICDELARRLLHGDDARESAPSRASSSPRCCSPVRPGTL